MRLKSIKINNFRLLNNVILDIEDNITLIVGKNNTGKTSLFEAINLFTAEHANRKISFADFSQSTYETFVKAYDLFEKSKLEGNEEAKSLLEKEIISLTPHISLQLQFEYNPKKDKLTCLNEFLVDLDKKLTEVNILMAYEPKDTILLYSTLSKEIRENKKDIVNVLAETLDNLYEIRYYAIDKNLEYRKRIEKGFILTLSQITKFEDIRAQRTMDDVRDDSNHSLTNSFAKYYTDKEQADEDLKRLNDVLQNASQDLRESYNKALEQPLSTMKKFGAKTPLTIPDITIESEFSAQNVLKQNIKYYYKNGSINLPECYNGLGYSNLIFIILEFMTFLKQFRKSLSAEWSHEEEIEDKKIITQNAKSLIIMIEEPESHMHPQMQQVFIRGIKQLLQNEKEKGIDIQLIITTHSSHIVAEAGLDEEKGFKQLRYFGRDINNKHFVRDFNAFEISGKEKETFHFLKKYLTLHKCDLFFADKIIMVEGLTERILMPLMIDKVAPSLQDEYITQIEIGGAYAHCFNEFLNFIKVKTLIITDLDSVKKATSGYWIKCSVSDKDAETVSNSVLKKWLPKKETLSELIACTEENKISNDIIRVTYQNSEPEDDYIARSFEESFIRVNETLLSSSIEIDGKRKHIKNQFSLLKKKKLASLQNPYNVSPSNSAKSNFAFDILSFDENKYGKWKVPNYIKEGLEWLNN